MKIFLLCFALFITGCAPVPLKPNFPSAPDVLQEPCPDLHVVPEDTTKLSDTLAIISKNYSLYHECRYKNKQWLEWYKSQKKIYDK